MANSPSQESEEALYEIKNIVRTLQSEWSENVDNLIQAKENIKSEDLFDVLDYLTFCDQFARAMYLDVQRIDVLLDLLADLQEEFRQNQSRLDLIEELTTEIQELRDDKQKKLQAVDEEYTLLAERALQVSQDLISRFSEQIEQEKMINLQSELNQNLDRELFLQELKDSLESYRQARENFISEVEMNHLQQLPEDQIPEDLGEERPDMDFILSQLDTAITACDIALLNKEIGD